MRLQKLSASLAAVAALCGASTTALAVDGVMLIDQARALAGNVTPGDTPGFPVLISRPGSYRLSSNLLVTDLSTRAIVITAPDVTLDLNGFQIQGPANCDPGGSGPCVNFEGHGVLAQAAFATILNGTIRGMGGHGVVCITCRVEGLGLTGNNGDGINAVALGLIVGNRAVSNGGFGLRLGPSSGYVRNVCDANTLGGVSGGSSLGGNACPAPL